MDNTIAVIGAGPSGLMCALRLAEGGIRVLLFEKMQVCGRKLLISGSGQCNITHEGPIGSFVDRYGQHGRFIRPSLMTFTNADLISFLENHNIPVDVLVGGKVFPRDRRAAGIRDLLVSRCEHAGVMIHCGEPVTEMGYHDGNFSLITPRGQYQTARVVIASGGITYPSTGSTGDGYRLAAALGHTIIPPGPALTPVYIGSFPFSDLSGISFADVPVAIFREGKKAAEGHGDLLITHFGLSGPVILDLSRYIREGDELVISFLTGTNREQIRRDLTDLLSSGGSRSVRTVLSGTGLPDRFVRRILEVSRVDSAMTLAHLDKQGRQEIIRWLTEGRLRVDHPGGPEEGMVTRGGVSLDEVNPKTLESRLVPGLFFSGEVLDIDGDCGGYNLQAAFSTGVLAAEGCRKGLGCSGKQGSSKP